MTPRVTVLSTIYNDGPFVREAIESVLAQTFTDFEYLIINDAAIDDSRTIVASYDDPRIRLVDNETNIGLTRSLNRGLALARGEYIARLDSNDVCFPERLAKQVAFLDAHPEVAVVGCQTTVIDVAGRRLRRAETRRPTTEVAMQWYRLFDTPIVHSAAMYRRRVVYEELGGYNEAFRVAQDAELWMRVGREHELANLGEALIKSRFVPSSISSDLRAPIRAGHVERWIPLASKQIRDALQVGIPPESALISLRLTQPASDLGEEQIEALVHALDACYRRFVEIHPAAEDDPEVRQNRADFLGVAFLRLAVKKRVGSLALFKRILRLHPRTAVRLLPKYVALAVFGEHVRELWRRRHLLRAARERRRSIR